MRAFDELIWRLCQHRGERLGGLSEGARKELELAVRADPTSFIDCPEDEAFALVVQALERHEASADGEDLLDDDAYLAARASRLERLERDCRSALSVDQNCLDAALLALLARDLEPERLLTALIELEQDMVSGKADTVATRGTSSAGSAGGGDLWANVPERGRLRLHAAIARTCLDSARYRMAAREGERVIALAPSDELGARHTCLLAYARLEDEDSFYALDARFSRQGSSWRHIAHAILLYKLGSLSAARRALIGYARLCEGGAYALLRPVLADVYLPDRPPVEPLSFEEATLAIHEADPIIMDVPDFIGWTQGQEEVVHLASSFARRNDYDW